MLSPRSATFFLKRRGSEDSYSHHYYIDRCDLLTLFWWIFQAPPGVSAYKRPCFEKGEERECCLFW